MNLNHMNKYNLSLDTNAGVCNAFSMIFKNVLETRRNIFKHISTGQKSYDWYKLTQDEFIRPVSFSPVMFDSLYFDYYTMESTIENVQLFGNYVIGDWEMTTLPVFTPFNNRSMLNDFAGTMFFACMREDFKSANAYLRASEMIESLENKSDTSVKYNEHTDEYLIVPVFDL